MFRFVMSFAILAVVTVTSTGTADEPNPADKATSQFAKLDDIRVHYKSLGSGDTALVFVHGWSCDHSFWRNQASAFDGKIRVILVDLPGHGKSDKPKIDYTMELFAKAVNAVLTEAGVNSAVLAGHSMGTPVARQFYRLYPKKTRALIAVDGSLKQLTQDAKQIEQIMSRFAGPDFQENVGKFVDGMFLPQTSDSVRKSVKDVMANAQQHVATSAMKNMFDASIWKDDEIKVPLQVINAKQPFWSPEYEQYVRKIAPQVDYRVMEGVGHFLMMEKPEEFNAIMTGFLRKQGVMKNE